MHADKKRSMSILSASVMAVLTLSVFLASTNRGPASAVTRYNEALLRGDGRLLREVSLGQINSPASLRLQARIGSFLAGGRGFQINRIERNEGYGLVYTEYQTRAGRYYYVFVTEYVQGYWLVDPDLTISLEVRTRGS